MNGLSAQTVRILEHLVEKPHIMKMFEIEMSNNVMMLLHTSWTENYPTGPERINEDSLLCSMDIFFMEPCRVRNVSDMCVGHTCRMYF